MTSGQIDAATSTQLLDQLSMLIRIQTEVVNAFDQLSLTALKPTEAGALGHPIELIELAQTQSLDLGKQNRCDSAHERFPVIQTRWPPYQNRVNLGAAISVAPDCIRTTQCILRLGKNAVIQ